MELQPHGANGDGPTESPGPTPWIMGKGLLGLHLRGDAARGLQQVLLPPKDGRALQATDVWLQEHRPDVPKQPIGLLLVERQVGARQQ